jgi:hypothetical protein
MLIVCAFVIAALPAVPYQLEKYGIHPGMSLVINSQPAQVVMMPSPPPRVVASAPVQVPQPEPHHDTNTSGSGSMGIRPPPLQRQLNLASGSNAKARPQYPPHSHSKLPQQQYPVFSSQPRSGSGAKRSLPGSTSQPVPKRQAKAPTAIATETKTVRPKRK